MALDTRIAFSSEEGTAEHRIAKLVTDLHVDFRRGEITICCNQVSTLCIIMERISKELRKLSELA